MGAPVQKTALSVLRYINSNGRASITQLREAGVIDDFKVLHRLYENNFVFRKGESRPTEYALTAKGLLCLQHGGRLPDARAKHTARPRSPDVTPSRTYINAVMRDVYRTGHGDSCGRVAL